MNFAQILTNFANIFRWWVTIAPWEEAIRVRLGKHERTLKPGVYLRIPWVDCVFRQSIRRRFSLCPTQTVSTKDGKAVTVRGGIRYAITDIHLLYNSVHQAQETIETEAQALVAGFVRGHELSDLSPAELESHVSSTIDLSRYGLGDVEFAVTDFVAVKTYRLISGAPRDFMLNFDDNLSTAREDGAPPR